MKTKYFLLTLVAFCMCVGSSMAQDVIYLISGDELNAKVTEIGIYEIKYLRPGTTTPVYIVSKSNVFKIVYENGTQDVFSYSAPTENATYANQPVENLTGIQHDVALVVREGKISDSSTGRFLNDREIRERLRINPAAYDDYKAGRKFRRLKLGFLISGIAASGIGVTCLMVNITKNDDALSVPGYMFTGLGMVCLVPGTVFARLHSQKYHQAVDTYNRGIQNLSSCNLDFGITPSGGVGLALTF
ncbi:MAG: hypothetical protein LBQ31_04600 [Bacteroidales bacterium]|jgi:hypothetical protein|nr:hypothetical protein [Bacteroidales bacterium]